MSEYTEKYLKIDLNTKTKNILTIPENILRKFLSGSGLGAYLLSEETDGDTAPLGSENVLIYSTGFFTATKIPSSGRHSIVSKSPLTGIWGESDIGGRWGTMLKKTGYDGIIIKGCSQEPVYLFISDKKVEIRDASHIWGKDTFDTDDILKEDLGDKVQISSIGQAGENCVPMAAIMHDGKHGRAAGRSGLGAVMGSKKLKAVVVYGIKKSTAVYEEDLKIHIKDMLSRIKKKTKALGDYGTTGGIMGLEQSGDMPIKNFRQSKWPNAEIFTGEIMSEKYLVKKFACGACPIGCGREIKIDSGKYKGVNGGGPEYESVCTLGTYCLVDDLEAVCKANEMCNRYGIDTISTGAAVAFAMEAYEKGVIDCKDCNGIELTWGNAEAMIEMVRQIGEKKGLGAVLGLGVKKAAEILGNNSQEYSIHVKGLELPAHDPRAFYSTAISYATSNRGACHLAGFTHGLEQSFSMPELGYKEPQDKLRSITKGKGIMTAKMQNLMGVFDSLKICKFVIFGDITVIDLIKCLNYVTGWDITTEELLKTGERIFNLKRIYNVNCGISRKDDDLPLRVMTSPRKEGGAEGRLPFLGEMLNEYYTFRNWTEEGYPAQEKLKELELD